MLKRDLITAEMQRLAEVLARIVGLRKSGNTQESDELFRTNISEKFGITDLEDDEAFNGQINLTEMPPEKLDMLSIFLYDQFESGQSTLQMPLLASRITAIYDLLESEHKIINLEHLERRRLLQQYR